MDQYTPDGGPASPRNPSPCLSSWLLSCHFGPAGDEVAQLLGDVPSGGAIVDLPAPVGPEPLLGELADPALDDAVDPFRVVPHVGIGIVVISEASGSHYTI